MIYGRFAAGSCAMRINCGNIWATYSGALANVKSRYRAKFARYELTESYFDETNRLQPTLDSTPIGADYIFCHLQRNGLPSRVILSGVILPVSAFCLAEDNTFRGALMIVISHLAQNVLHLHRMSDEIKHECAVAMVVLRKPRF